MALEPPRVLIIGYVWPEPGSSAAGLRDRNLIDYFTEKKCPLTFVSPSKSNEHREVLTKEQIPTFGFEPNDSRFDSFIRELNPDITIFDRFITEEQFGWRVRKEVPNSIRILDTQDVHFLRRTRRRALEAGRFVREIKNLEFDLYNDDSFREVASILRCDLTWVLSDFEFFLLTKDFGIDSELLDVNRFAYPLALDGPPFEKRQDFAFIGNFRHPPNMDAVIWMNEIWPKIRKKLPDAQLHFYGSYPPKEATEMNDPSSGFLIKGWAEDSPSTLKNYRVNLAPLRFGAGIKGKISDGWSVGTPVVSTTIGAEGMHQGFPWGGAIADEIDEFVDKAVSLHEEREKWNFAHQNSTRLIRILYSKKKFQSDLDQSLDRILTQKEDLRKKNFMGKMLWTQQFRSTEYFSRWIELKESIKKAKE